MYHSTDCAKVHKLATEMYQALEQRESGDKRTEWFLKEGSPEWMKEVIYAVSDDTTFKIVYEFTNEALSAIADADDDEDSIREAIDEIEPDVYTADLTAWLAENINHVNFLTEVLDEYGDMDDGFKLLAAAQMEHKRQIANGVLDKLIELADDLPDEDESQDEDTEDESIVDFIAVTRPDGVVVARLVTLYPADFDYDYRADNNVYPRE